MTTVARAWDVVVAGAGPAGSLAAHGLARAGAAVLLVDRAVFPRPKACGCCLNARAVAALGCAGLGPRFTALGPHRPRELRLRARSAEASLLLPDAHSLSRERFDAMLVAAAREAGATVVLGARAALRERSAAGTWTVDIAGAGRDTARARVVVDATGLGNQFAAGPLGGEVVRTRARLGAHVILPADAAVGWPDDAVTMTIGASGYVGAVRLEDGRWNLAAALDAAAVARARAIGPVVSAVLDSPAGGAPPAIATAAWHGTPRLSRRPGRTAADGVFALGDAAGYAEPFTGEGMACALQGARALVPLALDAVAGWRPDHAEAWDRVLRRDVQRRLAAASMAAWALRRRAVVGPLVAALARWPELAAGPLAWLNRSAAARGAFT